MKTINDITLYDLAGEDFDVWLSINKSSGFDLELEREDGAVFEEASLHPVAAEGLADFCRRYLRVYEKVTKEIAA